MQKADLPIFMQDSKTNEILREAAAAVPTGTQVYIVGGAVRNAIYYKMCGKKLPQRDYDLVVNGNYRQFVKNLRKIGFVYGFIRRKNHVTLKKPRVAKPKDEFRDYVFLDISWSKDRGAAANLRKYAGFTINGFALSLRDVVSKKWDERVISIPEAMADLKARRLRVKNISHPARLYTCIRFMSLGFRQPTKEETARLLVALGKLEKWRFKRNVRKVFSYVGGKTKALKLARKLGIKEDIFAWKTIDKLRKLNPGKKQNSRQD